MNQYPSYVKLDYARGEIRLPTILNDYNEYLVHYITGKTSLKNH
jgi:hypothetical protein